MQKSAFDIKSGKWNVQWPGLVAKHDLVYLSPPTDPMKGIAMGNGDIGVLAWCEDSKVIFAVNKCDLWDDMPGDSFTNWKPEEEDLSTTRRHACRITIDFKHPIFSTFYLNDFNAKLSLADASMSLKVSSVFGKASLTAFVDYDSGAFCVHLNSDLKDVECLDVALERYGSRTFSHWYRRINRNPKIGLGGTCVSNDAEALYVTHKLTSGIFGAGVKVLGKKKNFITTTESLHSGRISFAGKGGKDIEFAAMVTSPQATKVISKVKSILKPVENAGIKKIFAQHKDRWKQFWMKSYMEFGDDYLDNLWYLTIYYAGCSQRGKYPGQFINGLWGWNRDVQPWNFFFHWNQQQVYWPLNASGHHDLLTSYLNYRFDSLPYSKKTAQEIYRSKGAFVSDVSDRRGVNSNSEPEPCEPKELDNHTPVVQIALQFWTHYKFTNDRDFLLKQALPYLLEAASFFESLFKKGTDGKYHPKTGTAYEGWTQCNDAISDLTHAKALFETVIKALEEVNNKTVNCDKWKDILHNLAAFPTITVSSQITKRDNKFILESGHFKGKETYSDIIFAAGFDCKNRKVLTSRIPVQKTQAEGAANLNELFDKLLHFDYRGLIKEDDFAFSDGIFPWVEFAGIFPSGIIGLHNRTDPNYEIAVNTARLYAGCEMGWNVCPIVLARLGLGQELSHILQQHVVYWQTYCNGWGHYGPHIVSKIESLMPGARRRVEDASLAHKTRTQDKNKFSWETYPFRHMGMEAMSVLSCAMNEALLQSYDDIICVAPAMHQKQNARFTLHAQNGFVVSCEIAEGKILWVSIRSCAGNELKIRNPWKKAVIFSDGKKVGNRYDEIITLSTCNRELITLVPREVMMKNWKTETLAYDRNMDCKIHETGMIELGMPKMF